MIFKIYVPKKWAKHWRFLLKTKLNYEKNLIIILAFKKSPNFFAEIWRKSQKILIIASDP
jgi:hypothetical protein